MSSAAPSQSTNLQSTVTSDGQLRVESLARSVKDSVNQQQEASVYADTASVIQQQHRHQKVSVEGTWFGMELPSREPTPHASGLEKWFYGILGFQVFVLVMKLVCLCEIFSSFGTIAVILVGYYAVTSGEMYISTILAYQSVCMMALLYDVVGFCFKLVWKVMLCSVCWILLHLLLWVAYLAGFFFAHHIWLDWATTRNVNKGWHSEHIPDYFGRFHHLAGSSQAAMVGGGAVAVVAVYAIGGLSSGGASASGAAAAEGGATGSTAASEGAAPSGGTADPGAAEASGDAAATAAT